MKKLISALLTCTILLSSTIVFAENNTEEMERLLVLVKNRVENTEKYTEFDSNSYSTESGTNYSFNWSFSDDKNYSSLNISCNDSGVITSYNSYDSKQNTSSQKLSITGTKRDAALLAAKKEIKKLNPEIADNLIISDTEKFESFRNNGYSFQIQRYENGIPFLYDTGRINLNPDCSLKSFFMNYTTGFSFENPQNIISKENATSLYNENIGLDLYYISSYDESEQHTAKLVYAQKNNNKYIHATTGEVYEIKENYNTGYNTNLKQESALTDSAGGSYRNQLSEAELKNVLEIENLLSKEEADRKIRNIKYFNIPAEATVERSSLTNHSSKKEYYYNFSYQIGEDFADVTINAKTGEITSFSKWADIPDNATTEKEKINELSDEVIEYLAPEKSIEFKMDDSNTKNSFSRKYTRYVNDLQFSENYIYLSFDHEYNLTRYNISYDAIPFASPENIVSCEDAFREMDISGDYSVYYIADSVNKKFVPVYRFTQDNLINANTGKKLYESVIDENVGKYTDISGHYAENQIKTLSDYGIFLDGTELKPDEPITQKDFVALLSIIFYSRDVSVLRNNYDVKDIYISLPDTFFLEHEINPTAHLTRKNAAKLMVKAMGAEEYAKLPGIYAPLYNDVTEDIGYINILTGMGVLAGDGAGNFNPNKEITKAHALIMMYNYLSR